MESGNPSDGKLPYISRLLRTLLKWNAEFSSCQLRRRSRRRNISYVEQAEARCLLTAGALDTSFSDDGILVDQFQDGAFGGGQKILTQSDNSFYVIGDGTILRYLANGQLDPSFSYDGMAGFAVGFERIPATITDGAIQADGKLMLLGQTYLGPAGYYAPTSKEVVLRRFNIDGTADTSFGTDGTVKPALTTAVSLAIRSDGKILVTGTVGSGVTAEGAIARLEANGAIDSTFDGDGVRASLPNSLGSIVIQADDRMLVQGSGKLYRFAADGSFDSTFDTDGELVSPTTLFALQSDGRIVAVGRTTVGGQPEFAIYRYSSDGSADTSFDTDGVLNTTFGHAETPTAVSLLPNGNIFVSGKNTTGTLGVFAMYSTTGALDTTFTGSGRLYWNLNWQTSAVRNNGTLLLMRRYSTAYNQSLYSGQVLDNLSLVSLNPDASGDTTFGTSNTVVTPLAKGEDSVNAMALQSDGKIVVASRMQALGGEDFGVSRYDSDGTLDASFGNSGRMTIPLGTSFDEARDVAIQNDGKIVVVGTSNNRFLVVRLNANGTLDTTFDGDGIVTTAIGNTIAQANSVAIQQDGKILVGGTRNASIFSDPYLNRSGAVLRYNTDGTLDSTFGTGDIVSSSIGAEVTDIQVLFDGRIAFVSGQLYVRLQNGSPDLTFGTNGNTATGGSKFAVQPDGKIVVAANRFLSEQQSGMLQLSRFHPNGGVDNTFGDDGFVEVSANPFTPVAIAMQGSKILAVVAGASYRFNSDGSSDTSFGTNGRVSTPTTLGLYAGDLKVQPDGKIVIAGLAYRSGFPDVMRTDSFLIRYDGGSAPTDILLSANAIDENSASGTIVASLTSTDADTPESWTYALVAGVESNDNSLFSISGSDLVADASFDFEFRSSYSVRIRSTDSTGLWLEKSIAISVNNVNEVPAFSLQNTVTALLENTSTAAAVQVADVAVTDDAIGTNVFTLYGPDAAVFEIVDSKLHLRAGTALNFERKATYSVTVQLDDSAVGVSPDQTTNFSLSVTDVNEAPTLSLTSIVTSLNDNVSTNAAIRVADIAVADDAAGTNEFLLTGTESNLFEIVDSKLYLKAGSILNGAVKPELRLQVSVIDKALGSDPVTGGSASIQIHVAATTPEIIAPAPLVQPLRPTFAWTSISSATSYDVWIENLSTENSQNRQENITNSVYTANSDFGIGRYRVRIRSLDASQTPSRWSAPYEFRVTATVTWQPMEAVQRSSYPRLTWNPLPGADQYDLWINSLSPAKNPFVRITNLNQSAWTSSTAFPMGQYQAWVRGFAADGTSVTWSERFDFHISPTPVLTTAANVAFSGLPTITWNAIAGAVRFDVWVDNASTGTSQFDRASFVGTTYTPSKTFGIGKYRFWVRSIGAAGTASAWSSRLEFSVNTAATIQPLNRIQVTARPTVTWTALPGAARYDLWIDERSTPTSQAVRITNLTTSSWTTATDLPMGLYRAWVRGIATDGTAATWSQPVEFYVALAPVLTAGTNATFDQTPTFAWNPVAGAVHFDLTLKNLNSGATVITKTGITATSWTMPTDLPNGLYRWWVLAVNSKGLRSQSANVADIQIGGQPNVLAPLTATDRRPLFSWSAIEGAASFMLHVNRIDIPQAAVIQLSGLTGVSYQSTVALPIGTYRVWMRAVSTTGTLSPWSLPVDFAVT
jgi:uncharacterized delta-60 repeat protein